MSNYYLSPTRIRDLSLQQNGVMSLPGLGLQEPEETQKSETSQHDLAKECEWRFEVAAGKYTQVKVSNLDDHCTHR